MSDGAPMTGTPGLALAHRRFGAGKPLVLLHGGVGSWRHWHANMPELSRRFAVIAVDLFGYGDSEDVPPGLDEEGYLALTAQALDAVLGGERPAGLVGFSFGAVIAAAIAPRLGGAFDSLSLIAPGGFGEPKGRTLEARRVPRGGPDNREVREAVAYNLGRWMLSAPPPLDDPVVDMQIANLSRTRYDSRRLSLQDRLTADLAAVKVPLQLIWGEEDRLAFPSIAARVERCRAVVPDASVSIIPAAGHWAQHEAAEAVNRLLIDFHSR